MKLAILGTRGIPNYHGGFEQFAEYFSVYMVNKGHEVYVYNSHSHPYQERKYQGVNILHQNDPEDKIGTFGQFIYDLNCIKDARKRDFDIILQLGYTSSSVWGPLLPSTAVVVTNMDGLEWKRSKYNGLVQKFLKSAEKWAIKTSDFLVSDSIGIQNYIKKQYEKDSEYIAYGAEVFDLPDANPLKEYGVTEGRYNMLIARLEPENNIETILDSVVLAKEKTPLLVVGKHNTKYGFYLKKKYALENGIRFLGGIYNLQTLNNLRYFSNIYFHGHSVGGTNPSLLEAMASRCLIFAHNNIFNKSILGEDAFYFENKDDIVEMLYQTKAMNQQKVSNNIDKIKDEFTWDRINQKYEQYLLDCLNSKA